MLTFVPFTVWCHVVWIDIFLLQFWLLSCFVCRQMKQIFQRCWTTSFTYNTNETHSTHKSGILHLLLLDENESRDYLNYSCEIFQSHQSQLSINFSTCSVKIARLIAIDNETENRRNDLTDKHEWHCHNECKVRDSNINSSSSEA